MQIEVIYGLDVEVVSSAVRPLCVATAEMSDQILQSVHCVSEHVYHTLHCCRVTAMMLHVLQYMLGLYCPLLLLPSQVPLLKLYTGIL